MSMADHLSNLAADYTTTELSVTPQKIMPERSDKAQIVYVADNQDDVVVTKSNDSLFNVVLQWTYLSSADRETIEDFYHDSAKANARENTFYWQHPKDGNTYTVRFMTPLEVVNDVRMPSGYAISQLTLKVKGNKP